MLYSMLDTSQPSVAEAMGRQRLGSMEMDSTVKMLLKMRERLEMSGRCKGFLPASSRTLSRGLMRAGPKNSSLKKDNTSRAKAVTANVKGKC